MSADVTGGIVLVVGCTTVSAHGQDQMLRLAAQAKARGIRLLGVDTEANLRSGIWRMPADEFAALEFTGADAGACRAFAASHPGVAAVMTVKEAGVLPTALLSEAFGVAGNRPEAVRTIRNKDLCRGVLRAAGFDQPGFAVVDSLAGAQTLLVDRDGSGPWIVKPRDGQGSAGVSLVWSTDGLPAALELLDSQEPFLIEEFVEGEEFSAEGVMAGGVVKILGLTRKRTGAGGGFIETGHRTPAGLAATTDATARAEVVRAVTAAGITHGLVHAEFWVTATGRIVLGEIHARPGGDFIHALVEHTLPGFEMFGALLDDLLGTTPAAIPGQSGAAGSEFLVLGPGLVRAVEGWERVSEDPVLIAAHLDVRPGDVLGAVSSSADRHGVLVAGAAGPDEVETALAGARNRLRIEIGAA